MQTRQKWRELILLISLAGLQFVDVIINTPAAAGSTCIRLTIRPNGYMERGWHRQLIARVTQQQQQQQQRHQSLCGVQLR